MQKTALCLWFDTQAEAAAEFYSGIFAEFRVENVSRYLEGDRMPAGMALLIRCSFYGLELDLLNGGPEFQLNPALSLYISCETGQEADALWAGLGAGGSALMELGEYPFSRKFGWMQDKFGVSWQISLDARARKVTPFLMFTREFCGKAEQAARHYCSLFPDAAVDSVRYYGENAAEPAGHVMTLEFHIGSGHFMAMDSGAPHRFHFNEAASVMLYCRNQAEIDRAWDGLTADGGEESVCGWLRDPFGVWWQIVNDDFEMMMDGEHPERVRRVMDAMYRMKKPEVRLLREAYEGKG